MHENVLSINKITMYDYWQPQICRYLLSFLDQFVLLRHTAKILPDIWWIVLFRTLEQNPNYELEKLCRSLTITETCYHCYIYI